jgi:hypothetical protein
MGTEATNKDELAKICEAEFDVFSRAISKMGFDPKGFAFAILLTSKKKLIETANSFNLEENERKAVENRINLFK